MRGACLEGAAAGAAELAHETEVGSRLGSRRASVAEKQSSSRAAGGGQRQLSVGHADTPPPPTHITHTPHTQLNGKWELRYTTSASILGTSKPALLRPSGPIYQFLGERVIWSVDDVCELVRVGSRSMRRPCLKCCVQTGHTDVVSTNYVPRTRRSRRQGTSASLQAPSFPPHPVLLANRCSLLTAISTQSHADGPGLRAKNQESAPFFNSVTAELSPLSNSKVKVQFKVGAALYVTWPCVCCHVCWSLKCKQQLS